MIRFPKRPRSKSIDLEDGDLVEVGTLGTPSEPDDLADTGVVPPKANAGAAGGSSLAPVAMNRRVAEETFVIPRLEPHRESRISAIFAAAGDRPSLPWAAALLALGAIGAAGSMRLLDALDGRSHAEPPAAAAALPPALAPIAPPVTRPPAAPVVLKFGAGDAVTVAVDAPKPAAPPAAIAVAPVGPAPAAPKPPPVAVAQKSPQPVVAAAPAPSPSPPAADSAKRPASLDSLAEQQLKAALK